MINETSEKVTGVIPALSTGWLGRQSYSLIVTDHRLIFAKYSSELMKQEREKAVAGLDDKGFFGRWKASVSSGFNFHERYYEMDPETILKEDEDNYEITPEEIESVKTKSGNWDLEHSKSQANEMTIKWSGGKEKFKFHQMNPKQVKGVLKPLLGTRLD